MTKRFLFALIVPQSTSEFQLRNSFNNAAQLAGITVFNLLLIEEGTCIADTDPWQLVSLRGHDKLLTELQLTQQTAGEIARARDEWQREFNAAQATLIHTRNSLRVVTSDRDRLLGELQSARASFARASLEARRITIAHEVGAEAFDDMKELRARAKRYAETRVALAQAYGKADSDEWKRLCLSNQAAMLSLTVLREKLGV